jgi:hypothetical protein
VWSENDPLLTALVKGFVRHDIFTQRMFRDFSSEMLARYGQGLEGLFDRHLADLEGAPQGIGEPEAARHKSRRLA